jgi:cytochrome o ubiquinol oxidase subunit IV
MSSDPTSSGPTSPERILPEEAFNAGSRVGGDHVPGEVPPELAENTLRTELRSYIIGLALSIALTAASFLSIGSHLIYGPSIVMAVVVFGLAQVGIHLIFFLHLTTSPDNTNNALALAFGFLIVCMIVFGSIWIMYNMKHNVMAAVRADDVAGLSAEIIVALSPALRLTELT